MKLKQLMKCVKKYTGKLFCPYCGEKVDAYINGKKQEKYNLRFAPNIVPSEKISATHLQNITIS